MLKRTLLLILVFCSATIAADRPNVVLIMADDMGYECLSANGSLDYETPNLDRMAGRGLRFEHCYSQPICTPSRVKLMTGQSNKRNYVKFGRLDRKLTTFAQLLKKADYATCIAGKWQLGKETDAPQHFGFDQALLWQHTRGRMDKKKHDTRYPNPRLEKNSEKTNYPTASSAATCFWISSSSSLLNTKSNRFWFTTRWPWSIARFVRHLIPKTGIQVHSAPKPTRAIPNTLVTWSPTRTKRLAR